ncbi:MAG: DNA helicase, partial [Shewanella fodinae]|nr:DNA helicase [Shewanella fodinae]
NPVRFFKTSRRCDFSTIGVPRYLCTAHIESGYLHLPRGLKTQVETLLEQQNCTIRYQDKRYAGQRLSALRFHGTLRSQQAKAVIKEKTKKYW